jgi:hypothetical protein
MTPWLRRSRPGLSSRQRRPADHRWYVSGILFSGIAMRKIILMMSISVDGFIEGPNRELDWQMVDEELHSHFNDQLRPRAGTSQSFVTLAGNG